MSRDSLLLEIALETVSFPIKFVGFYFFLVNVYQKVFGKPNIGPLHAVTEFQQHFWAKPASGKSC